MTESPESEPIFLHQDVSYWARKYADRGWRMVPLFGLLEDGKTCACKKGAECGKSSGKHPIYGSWASRATAELAEVEDELRKPSRNIGLAMGAGLVAIDVDGEDGLRSLKRMLGEHPGEWPDGPVAETGSGWLHFLFATQEVFKNSVKIVDGIDVRSEGGQIVACPSLHRSGRRYRWMPQDPDNQDGPSSFDLEVPQLPEWLAEILRGTARLEFDISGWLKDQAPAVQGESGSKVLMRVTHKLVRAGMCRTLERYYRVIAPWNARCEPPWSDAELERAFDNAFSKFKTEASVELPMDKNGQVICGRTHVDQIVRQDPRYEGQFRFNTRLMKPEFQDGALTATERTRIEVEICNRYRLRSVNPLWLRESILAYAEESSYDPVAEYLRGLEWDGTKRIAQVPERYLKTAMSPINAAMFYRWMVGAARRALEPGCKMDNVLILYSPEQGWNKSSFFYELARGWHIDSRVDLTDKDAYLQLHKSWILEWSELSSIARMENEAIKAFISSREDNFRPPYGEAVVTKPRASVIVGTTNKKQMLSDPTGSRRYWILEMLAPADLLGIVAVRDQLWAEAVAAVKAGEQHWLTKLEDAARKEAATDFRSVDTIYKATCDALEHWGDQISWSQLCAMVDVETHPGPRIRDSICQALEERDYVNKRVLVDKKRVWMWVREPRPVSPDGVG